MPIALALIGDLFPFEEGEDLLAGFRSHDRRGMGLLVYCWCDARSVNHLGGGLGALTLGIVMLIAPPLPFRTDDTSFGTGSYVCPESWL